MILIDNYLTQVSQLLPEKGRDDILAELRQSLEEQVQARTESGDSAREASIAALSKLGHPIKVAAAYQPNQYLIGPGIYPAYRYMLLRVIVGLMALHLILALFVLPSLEVTVSFGDVVSHQLSLLGWGAFFVTLGFVVVEYSGEKLRFFERFNAASLQQASTRPLEFGDTAWNLIIEGVFLLWWNGVLVLAHDATVTAAPIWEQLHWPVNFVVGAMFLLHLWLILRGYWMRRSLYLEILLNLAGLSTLTLIATADHELLLSGNDMLGSIPLNKIVNGAMIVIALTLLWDTRKALLPLLNRE
ncbi:MAG: hypothetical protein FJ194_10585 [Gammaproteobacteria bacterium]|nr:hypothetical protein [Gammaproteobacteria bacterium]